ncbi:unnamed protein product [Lymnaea stagnalis]|uniref:Major facilitator superfamily (MFS) profile domain-containing protein n=1 Tax=Lymnaea stagnalis TaxID=6523 RepID=A0AAV2IKZ5_LYMST
MSPLRSLRDCWYRVLNSGDSLQPMRERARESRRLVLAIVFLTNLLDNLLLTSVVPIIPAFLLKLDKEEFYGNQHNLTHLPQLTDLSDYTPCSNVSLSPTGTNESLFYHHKFQLAAAAFSENGRVGWLLSSKAVVQLFANLLVGPLCNKVGYPLLLFGGTVIVFISSVVFAFAESYIPLFIARSVQGLGSAAAIIAGMSIVARRYPDDKSRSQAMGISMGGAAFGVLVGYPFGGIMYTFVGKTVAFLVIAGLLLLDVGLQWFVFGVHVKRESYTDITPLHVLLRDRYILIAVGAVWLTTMSMSVLEPTVPLWVMGFMHVKNWELGLIFLPDSLGYLIGTNCFGIVAQRIGRWSCTLFCMLLIALCQVCLPFATAVPQLILPHFGLGLGLGVTDAAIMPFLALLVDVRNEAFYGCVYAIAQLAVCLAYSFGPLAAGMVVKAVGFPWLMRGMAVVNVIYCPLCYILSKAPTSLDEDAPLNKPGKKSTRYTQDSQVADEASFSYGQLFEDED